ncbi:MAG: GGDEF domain-containing protein [Motiliproteus sp.]|nr:GGDEF domain-containing protein [Motiliproteus sp.]MCW9054304.1 GGDEF domain-containing protein [Motiliproteus sp.]
MLDDIAQGLHARIVKFTSVAPLSRSSEELTRFQHYVIFTLLGIPCMTLFGFENLHSNPTVFLLALLSGTGLTAGVIILRHVYNGIWIYRTNAVIFIILIAYMVLIGGAGGSKVLWVYTAPPIMCFLLGAIEGLFWTTVLLICIVLIFWFPQLEFFDVYDYPAAFKLRLVTTYSICSMIAVWLEYSRNAYYRDSRQKAARLEQKNQDLKEEMRNRIQLENKLRELATTDPLTEILNRRAFFEEAEKELHKHRRFADPFTFALLDIDDFKQVNDRYGHPMGDQLIKEISAQCAACLREIDIIGRIGGEEFAVMMIKTPQEEALKIAERIRSTVSEVIVAHQPDPISRTISIGLYTSKDGSEEINEIYHKADTALYKAKEKGKDRVLSLAD